MSLLKKKQLISSAEVVDNHLILSLPNASEPVVWRMALDKIGTASFEIKPVKGEDAYKLLLTPKKGTAETIAPFASKEEALAALMQASDAMQRPAQQSTQAEAVQNISMAHMGASGIAGAGNKASRKWLYLLLAFLAVVGLYALMLKQMPNKVDNFGNALSSPSSGGANQIGVPQSADDFLNGL